MSGPAGLAPQRTALAWQRTALDFVVLGGLLTRAAGGWRPLRLAPAALSFLLAAAVLLFLRRHHSPLRVPAARALMAGTVTLALAAAVLAGWG